jgi:uncharacterized lipoprotein
MTIEEINSMWAEDSKIDETNIIRESAKIPELHNKYYMMYVREALKSKKLKADLKELEKAKIEYFNGSMDQEELKQRGWKPNPLKILRQDIERYVEADKDIIQLSLKIAYHESTAKYLEDIVKQINGRNFVIKNIIDWSRFTSGVN